MAKHDRFTYDVGTLKVGKIDRAKIEQKYEEPGEYLVCSDELADNHVKGQILESLWAFNSDFLSNITGLDLEVFEKLAGLSEAANEAVKVLVKSTCGLDYLVEQAVAADGRGNFLASYDAEELEFKLRSGKTVYLYRCN